MADDKDEFAGKVAYVTGAGRGIGRATALAFARAGASVAVVDFTERDNRETTRLIEQSGGRALALTCDVRKSQEVEDSIAKTMEAFGRFDVAFNNAGVDQTQSPTAESTEEDWDRVVDTDLRGVFVCMKHQLAVMIAQGGGAIVNTSSGAGLRGFPGQPAYVAAKHGVVGLTKAAALDHIGQNIRVNAVCPGIVDTPMMAGITGGTPDGEAPMINQEPVGRMGRPEEIAAAVLWLCSDASSFVVGHALVVDGGQTL